MTNNVDDLTLWQGLRQGDDNAFKLLYERYVRILISYGLKMQPHREVVEDAIQDLFVDLWRLRSRISPTDSVKFYLFRSLRRKLHKANHGEEVQLTQQAIGTQEWLIHELSVEQLIITTENDQLWAQRIQYWLDNLTPRQHEALLLRYYQDFSYTEIAELLAISEQSARNLVQKALHNLRQMSSLLIHLACLLLAKNIFWF